jgi:hypothetical protein
MASFKKGAKMGTTKLDNPPSYQQATQKVEEADLVSFFQIKIYIGKVAMLL